MSWIPIFRAGKYPQGEFTPEDIHALVHNTNTIIERKVYDPVIAFDHPEGDKPRRGDAGGWIRRVRTDGNVIEALLDPTDDARLSVKGGKRRYLSAEIDSKFNLTGTTDGETIEGPVFTGVALLGAARPQIKGLVDLQTVEFSEVAGSRFAVTGYEQHESTVSYFSEIETNNPQKEANDMADNKMEQELESLKAKVSELTKSKDAEKKRADEAEQKLTQFAEQKAKDEKAAKVHSYHERIDKLEIGAGEKDALKAHAEKAIESENDLALEFIETRLAGAEASAKNLPKEAKFTEEPTDAIDLPTKEEFENVSDPASAQKVTAARQAIMKRDGCDFAQASKKLVQMIG